MVILTGLLLAALALALRLGIHFGRTPGGVDTWYYLASADVLRRTWRFPIRLPQYLLHGDSESYPPGFILLLALLPHRWVKRNFWLLAPLTDTVHLLLLYGMTVHLGGSARTACLVYTLTPLLVAESRSLNPRPLGMLLNSLSMLLVFSSLTTSSWLLALGAVLSAAALFLTHATSSAAFCLSTVALSLVFHDARYFGFAAAGFGTALLLTGKLYCRVLLNYLQSLLFWRKYQHLRGAHPLYDSPAYATLQRPRPASLKQRHPALRMLGENPFLLCMPFVPVASLPWWGQRTYWWAAAALAGAVAIAVCRPLRVLGPPSRLMRGAIFPMALLFGLTAPTLKGAVFPAMAAGLCGIAYFYYHLWTRTSEHTATLPHDLRHVVEALARMPRDGVLCLPDVFADYVCYASGKKVLWGGHSGDHSKFELIFPVFQVPAAILIERYALSYVLLDLQYVTADELQIQGLARLVTQCGHFALYETQ